MQRRPVADEPTRLSGADLAGDELSIKVELRVLAAMLGVEMSRLMLAVEHTDDDSEEYRDERHAPSVAEFQKLPGNGGQVRNSKPPNSRPGADLRRRLRGAADDDFLHMMLWFVP